MAANNKIALSLSYDEIRQHASAVHLSKLNIFSVEKRIASVEKQYPSLQILNFIVQLSI